MLAEVIRREADAMLRGAMRAYSASRARGGRCNTDEPRRAA
jgi:hypothetical protein